MFRDMEGNIIELAQEGNGHILVYGKSGQGKTYLLCRMLEKYCQKDKKILIIDYSGSYSEGELQDKGFRYNKKINRFILPGRNLEWNFRVGNNENFQQDVTDALLEALKCNGYFQKKLLGDAIREIIQKGGKINFPEIAEKLEQMLQKEEAEKISENRENIGRLLTRLAPYVRIGEFNIVRGITSAENLKQITIVDVSDYPESQRRFLTEFLVSLFWRETYRQEFSNRCDVLLLDEMQFLSVGEGSMLSAMLREGRKKGLEVVLATQFIDHYEKEEIQALQQADNIIIFSPTFEDLKRSARMINPTETKIWEKILQELRKGQAVLKGSYRIGGRSKVSFGTILIKIEEKNF